MGESSQEKSAPKQPAVDHGWAWVVTFAVFCSCILCVGYFRAFGVFFVAIIDTFQTNASITSLIMGVQNAVFCVSALLVHNLLLELVTVRTSAQIGGLIMATGMMLGMFANNVAFIIFCLGVLVGLGNAMTYGPGFVLLGQYFDKHRAIAMSLANAGASVGSMSLPVLATHLVTHYGLRPALLLYGAVTLHLCVFSSLYRPLSVTNTGKGVSGHSSQGDSSGADSTTALLEKKKHRMVQGKAVQSSLDPSEKSGHLNEEKSEESPFLRRRTAEGLEEFLDGEAEGKDSQNTQGRELKGKGENVTEDTSSERPRSQLASPASCERGVPEIILSDENTLANSPGSENNENEIADDETNFPEDNALLEKPKAQTHIPNEPKSTVKRSQNVESRILHPERSHLTQFSHKAANARQFSSTDNCFIPELGTNRKNPALHEKRSLTEADLRTIPGHNLLGVKKSGLVSSFEKNFGSAAMYASNPHLMVPPYKVSVECVSGGSRPDEIADKEQKAPIRSVKDFCGLIFDVKLLRNALFWLVQIYVCVGVMGATGAGSYIPAVCKEKGLDKDDTALVLTIWGACNLVGRLASGLIADRKWLRPPKISALSFLGISLLFHTLRILPHSFPWLLAFGVLYGLLEGTYFTMLPLIIIDFVSLDNFSRTFGFAQLSQGAFASILYPILGRLRDLTGDYHATFHLLGACSNMATILLLLEPLVRALKWAKPREILDLSTDGRL